MKKLFLQIIKFGFVGVLCFIIDYGLMILQTELLGFHYLISSAISFTVAVVVNYYLSIRYVFNTSKKISSTALFFTFVILSIIGLGINQLIMLICVEFLIIFYTVSKLISTIVVMIFNFITRKYILEKRKNI